MIYFLKTFDAFCFLILSRFLPAPGFYERPRSRARLSLPGLRLRCRGSAKEAQGISLAFKHKPGNPSRKTFLIAPQKKGFGILKRSSIKDKMRHIGTSISSCIPSKRLDLVNGAVAKFSCKLRWARPCKTGEMRKLMKAGRPDCTWLATMAATNSCLVKARPDCTHTGYSNRQ